MAKGGGKRTLNGGGTDSANSPARDSAGASANRARRPRGKGAARAPARRRAGPPGPKPRAGGKAALFDQRRYHRLVVEHARAKFLKGEYSSSVSEACKALEGLVRKKSGIEDFGNALMGKAFGDEGALAVSLPGLAGETRGNVRRGIMHMCMGIMSSVRNPISHEPEIDFPMTRDDALDILGVVGYLCRQVERTRRMPKAQRAPPRGGRRSPRKPATGGKDAGMPHGGGDAAARAGAGAAVELSVRPESVEQGGMIVVTVTGMGIDEWYVGVISEEGRVKSPMTRLEAYGLSARNAGGEDIYSLPVNTLGYAPGEHRVCVSRDKSVESRGARIKKFTVTNYGEMQEADDVLAESEGVRDALMSIEERLDRLER